MSAPVRPGEVLAGKYRVERVLGEGGMGVVVAARHLQLDQTVALKFLLPEAVANPEALDRFGREARNAVRLKSEHVARIIDVGTLDSGAPYIVMEFLEGSDLSGVLAQQGALPVPVAVDIILQTCDAIAEAHALGIIHRDLKPQNLFVTRRHDGTSVVKVLDFGISKSIAAGGNFAATRSQAVMGSPAYMSPEQMRSTKFVDARTDVWALGIILYQLVVGHVPWEAEAFTELCFKIAMDPLPPFPSRQSARFEEVVRRCLEKDPDRRFSDVDALAVALSPFAPAHAQPLVERIGRVLGTQPDERSAVPAAAAIGPGTLREAAGQRMMRTTIGSRQRRFAGLVALIGILAGVAVTAVVFGGGRGDEPAGMSRSSPAPGHAAAQPASTPSPRPVVVQPPPPPPRVPTPEPPIAREPVPITAPPTKVEPPTVDEPIPAAPPTKVEPPTVHKPVPAAAPPIKVGPPPAPSTASKPHDKEPPSPPIATPPKPRIATPPPPRPPTKSAATPDPLSSPD